MKRTLILALVLAVLCSGIAGARGLKKNTGSQVWIVFAFDRTDNSAKTGDAANITADVYIDGVVNAVDDTNPTELAHGYYLFNLAQDETNGDNILIDPVSATGNIQVIGKPGVCWTDEIASIADIWNAATASYGGAGTYAQAVEDILTDTAEIGAAGAGLTAVPWNASWDAEVQSEVDDALVVQELDHLVHVADADDPADNSIVAKMAASDGDWSGFSATTDALEALRDQGDAAWAGAARISGSVATASTASVFTLSTDFAATAGAYPQGVVIGVVDADDSKEYIGFIKSYSASRVVTLLKSLPITPANADVVYIYQAAIVPNKL